MTDLDLIALDDLLKAIKRYDHMVFIASKDMGANQGEDYSFCYSDHSFATRRS